MKVHTVLGPGLLESAYQKCMQYELQKDGLKVACEAALPIVYEKITIDAGYRIDMMADDMIIIENITVEKLLPIHEAQLLTYLKLRSCKLDSFLTGMYRVGKMVSRGWSTIYEGCVSMLRFPRVPCAFAVMNCLASFRMPSATYLLQANYDIRTIEAPCSKLQGVFDPQGYNIYSNRSLTPQLSTGLALAPDSGIARPYRCPDHDDLHALRAEQDDQGTENPLDF